MTRAVITAAGWTQTQKYSSWLHERLKERATLWKGDRLYRKEHEAKGKGKGIGKGEDDSDSENDEATGKKRKKKKKNKNTASKGDKGASRGAADG